VTDIERGAALTAGAEIDIGERRHRVYLFLAFAAAILVRAAVALSSGAAAPQEIRYINIAVGLIDGSAFEQTGTRFPAIIQPPFYPFLIFLARSVMKDPLVAARGVSVLLGALLVFPAAALTRRILGPPAARRAAWIAATYPLLCHISGLSMTEPTFGLLVALSALLMHRAGENKGGAPTLLGAGLLLGASFLTRPEGLAYAFAGSALVFLYLWRAHKRGIVRAAGLACVPILGFLLMAVPYVSWVHGKTGRWLVSPKAILTQAHNVIMTEGQAEGWPEKYGSRLFYERVKFGLNKDGTEFRSSELFRELGLLPGGGQGPRVEMELSALLQPHHLALVVFRNLLQIYVETIKSGYVVPTFLMMFLALGFASRPWRPGRERRGHFLMVWWLLAGGTWTLSYVQQRFLYPSIVFVIPWMAEGWRRLEVWARESFGSGGGRWSALLERSWAGVLTVVVAVGSLVHVIPPTRQIASTWKELREAGQELRESGAGEGTIMALTPVAAYYARMPFEMLPYADLDRVLAYARMRGARYLVADMVEFPNDRPQILSLLRPSTAPADLRPVVRIDDDPERRVIVYEILPPGTFESGPGEATPPEEAAPPEEAVDEMIPAGRKKPASAIEDHAD